MDLTEREREREEMGSGVLDERVWYRFELGRPANGTSVKLNLEVTKA